MSLPLRAVIRGALAGAVGTAVMDGFLYWRYREGGGEQSFADWESSAGLESWDDARAPAQVGKRLYEGLLQRELPAECARNTNNAMHWGYGLFWGAVYGILTGTREDAGAVRGAAFGTGVWLSDYAALPHLGLYKPIWEYDGPTLTQDWAAHAAYGIGVATAFGIIGPRDSASVNI